MKYFIAPAWVVDSWADNGHWVYFGVDAETQREIIGTLASSTDNARWIMALRHPDAVEVEDVMLPPEPVTSGSIRYTVPQTWPVNVGDA